MNKPTVKITSSSRLFRSGETSTRQPTCTRLSIIDAACANFTPSGALWFFEAPHESERSNPDRFSQSLCQTLHAFPHFEGRLRRVNCIQEAAYNLLDICYGDDKAPGVQFDVAHSDLKLEEIIPSANQQALKRAWKTTTMPREDVFVQGRLANGMTVPLDGEETGSERPDPTAVVQVTALNGRAFVIGVKIAHPLADAHTLALFVRAWSEQHQILLQEVELPLPTAYPFDPSLVDGLGLVMTSESSKAQVLEQALAAPMHRFDWWDNADAPFQWTAMSRPKALQHNLEAVLPLAKGQKMDWSEWNQTSGVEHVVLRFNEAELGSLGKLAEGDRVSTLNILIAHIWSAINRARGFSPDHDGGQVYADISFGLRARLHPPLPETFIGSPLANMAVPMSGHRACSTADIAAMAKQIRSTVNAFTPDLVAAHIYGLTQELTPQRVWQCFLGKRHILVTSWVHTGVFEVDFGGSKTARYVHPIMPMVDGCIQIIEGTPVDRPTLGTKPGKWYANGVNINVYLESNAMAKLLADPDLHPKI